MIDTVHLFPKLDALLISLLRSLNTEEWQAQTIAKRWNVKDVASHLLDGNCRAIAAYRDKYLIRPDRDIATYQNLVEYLNEINHQWILATKRLSPELLINLLESTGKEYCELIAGLDPDENALFAVAWAGESVSKNWFHIAREYTEKWHHQQQIRDAVNRPGILTQEFMVPLFTTFLLGLPYLFREVDLPPETVVDIRIDSLPGSWQLIKDYQEWIVTENTGRSPDANVILPPDIAWKLFTKGINPGEATKSVSLEGNISLAKKVLELVAVMA